MDGIIGIMDLSYATAGGCFTDVILRSLKTFRQERARVQFIICGHVRQLGKL